jgi:hypothetical protein
MIAAILARKIVRVVEAAWSRRVGAARIEDLRRTLKQLLDSEPD